MLGKLFKHEFKTTGKILLPLELILIGVTLLGAAVINIPFLRGDSVIAGIIIAGLVLFYVLGVFALFIVTYIYLTIRFYRSMYSDEGYLTHTLPVSTSSILNTKIVVSVFWVFLTLILTVLSIFCLSLSAAYAADVLQDLPPLPELCAEFEHAMGLSVGGFIGWGFLFLFLSSCSGILMIYCSISIGQLFNKYKVLASIITYIIIYIVLQISNTLISLYRNLLNVADQYSYLYIEDNISMMTLFGPTFRITIIESIVLIIAYYITCAYISNKKLNLD